MSHPSMSWFFSGAIILGMFSPALAANVSIDGSSSGRVFHGVGAVSQGTSDALYDYAEPYRSQILDWLFKPKYGMSLNRLRIEMGCGENTTSGAEPSHAYSSAEIANPVPRGIEFWLIDQAKRRNPKIELEACPWGWPSGYQYDGNDYKVAWVKCLKDNYGYNLDYMSWGANEVGYDKNSAKSLRTKLNSAGYTWVKLLGHNGCGDDPWTEDLNNMAADPEFANVVDVLSNHYSMCEGGGACPTPAAIASGKMLGNSELHLNYPVGNNWGWAFYLGSALNMQYAKYRTVSSVQWHVFDCMLFGMYPDVGGLNAKWPWSGYYEMKKIGWGYAHTCQFTEPGWKYLDNGCGYQVGDSLTNWVTLRDPASNNWSMLIAANRSLTINATISNGLSTSTIQVWKSDSLNQFIRQSDIVPSGGSFSIVCSPRCLYSLTTTTGQQKAQPTPGTLSAFPMPYSENYESYASGDMPRYHSDRVGSWEAYTGGPGNRKCLKQICTNNPDAWHSKAMLFFPATNLTWNQISADVYVANSPPCRAMVAVHHGSDLNTNLNMEGGARGLQLMKNGTWQYVNVVGANPDQILTSGTISNFDGAAWHNLKIVISSGTARLYVDNNQVGTYPESSPNAAFLRSSMDPNLFDNVYIGPTATPVFPESGHDRSALPVSVPQPGEMTLYSVTGQKLMHIAAGAGVTAAGLLQRDGRRVTKGVYVCTSSSGNNEVSRRLVVPGTAGLR